MPNSRCLHAVLKRLAGLVVEIQLPRRRAKLCEALPCSSPHSCHHWLRSPLGGRTPAPEAIALVAQVRSLTLKKPRAIRCSAADTAPYEWPRSCRLPRMPNCPRCDSQYIRASYSKSTLDSVVKWLLNNVPFRCRKCRLRFYSREPQQNTDSFGKPYRILGTLDPPRRA